MKNILFLSSWYPNRVHSTLGNFVNYHAKASALYNNVFVLYIMPDDSISNYEIDHFTDGPINTTIVYFRRGRVKYYNYWKAFKIGWKQIRNHNKIDLVHMNVIYPHVWQAIYLKWKQGIHIGETRCEMIHHQVAPSVFQQT